MTFIGHVARPLALATFNVSSSKLAPIRANNHYMLGCMATEDRRDCRGGDDAFSRL